MYKRQLDALIECTGVDRAHLSAYHIGFVIGPCLNAGGRLDTAKRALELLRASSRREAAVSYTHLDVYKRQEVLASLALETPTAKDKGKIMKELMPKVKGKADRCV